MSRLLPACECGDCARLLFFEELSAPIGEPAPRWSQHGELLLHMLCPCGASVEVLIAEDALIEAPVADARAA